MASPTPFARLLKASKFASFDASIGQVYTSPPAHAARGNYGLKRALRPRRHGVPLTVQAVDTIDQQTNWEPAAAEARYVQRWEGQPPPNPRGQWAARLGAGNSDAALDSDFAPKALPEKTTQALTLTLEDALAAAEAQHGKGAAADLAAARALAAERRELHLAMTGTAISNSDAFGPSRFDRHLHALRGMRPRFARFVADRSRADAFIARVLAAHGEAPPKQFAPDLLQLALTKEGGVMRRLFLAALARAKYAGPGRQLEAQPHRTAGLAYAPRAPLSHVFLLKPEPARYVDAEGAAGKSQTLFGGVRAELDPGSRRRPDGAPRLRVIAHHLHRAPALGAGLSSANVDVGVADVTSAKLANKKERARPGSREWAGGVGGRSSARADTLPLTALTPIIEDTFGGKEAAQDVLAMLNGLVVDVPE